MSTAKARLKTAVRRAARLVARRPRPAILMYHRIGRETFDPWGLAVELDRFAAQVEWLGRHRTVVPLTKFAQLHRDGTLPADAVALTFDDGYASVLDAVPLLEQHGLHATVFLPVELIERGLAFWWDELAQLVIGWNSEILELNGEQLLVPPPHERDRFWAPDAPPHTPRQKLFQTLWSKLHAMRTAALEAAMEQLRSQEQVERSMPDPPLTPEEACSVSRATVDFGSHGVSHPSLPALANEEKAREIGESQRRCEALTGTAPAAFAYPFGDVDEESIRLVEQAGYACACATGDRFVTRQSKPFALPRLRVGNWDVGGLRDMLGA
jgi:peptidoglycan/xylan/chitin deacetylase (PgdA/CDA1 family)